MRLCLCTLDTGYCNGYIIIYNGITERQRKMHNILRHLAFLNRDGRLKDRDFSIQNYYSSNTLCLFIRLRIQVECLINKYKYYVGGYIIHINYVFPRPLLVQSVYINAVGILWIYYTIIPLYSNNVWLNSSRMLSVYVVRRRVTTNEKCETSHGVTL